MALPRVLPPLQVSTLYYEVIDLPLPEYESLMNFKVLQSAASKCCRPGTPQPAALPSAPAGPHTCRPAQRRRRASTSARRCSLAAGALQQECLQ